MKIELCSGVGRYHTDNPSSPRPRPFNTITLKEIADMAQNPPAVSKPNARWFIPSTLLSRDKRSQMERGYFYALTADIDHSPPEFNRLMEVVKTLTIGDGGAALGYLSRSATEDCQKAHVIIPTVALNGRQWQLSQRVLCDRLKAAGIEPDEKVLDANQIIYLPNRGQFYKYELIQGGFFNPLETWKSDIAALVAQQSAVEQQRLREVMERELARPPSPMVNSGNNLIQTFNSTYSVEDILTQAGYDQKGSDFRHPNSQTGNYSASVKNGRVFTLSSSDPLYSNHAHDAFSAFAVLFHGGNVRASLVDAGNNWIQSDNGLTWNQARQAEFITEGRA